MDRIRKPKKKKMKWTKKIGKPVVSMLKEKQKTMKTREKIYRKTMKAKEKIHRKAIKARKKKVEKNRLLNDEELMQFIILPLSYRTKEEKQRKVRETVKLATKIQDKKQQIFTLAGILVFTDKVIDRETAGRIRRVIEMTQVAQIFEEEKRQALAVVEEEKRRAVEILEEEKRRAVEAVIERALKKEQEERKRKERETRQMVIRMIKKNYPAEEIASFVPDYTKEDVEQLKRRFRKTSEEAKKISRISSRIRTSY